MNSNTELPSFKYHPDPVSSGVFEESDNACIVCNSKRGYVYVGAFYSVEEISNICPWCIKSGAAAEKFDGTFYEEYGLEEVHDHSKVEELLKRTPGFFPARETWPSCCGDFCKLIGKVTYSDIERLNPNLDQDMSRIQKELEIPLEVIIKDLKRAHSPLWAHLFQCLYCDSYRLIADYE